MTRVRPGTMTRASAATYVVALVGYGVCSAIEMIHVASTHPSSPWRIAPPAVIVIDLLCGIAVLTVAALNWRLVQPRWFGPARGSPRRQAFAFALVFSVWGIFLPAAVRSLNEPSAGRPA